MFNINANILPSEQPPANKSVFETRKRERKREEERKPKFVQHLNSFSLKTFQATQLNLYIQSQENASHTGMEETFNNLKTQFIFEVFKEQTIKQETDGNSFQNAYIFVVALKKKNLTF